jgi:hypothetical protein
LALLRNHPIEEVERHCPRRDVYHRGNILAVDADIVLLFAVEALAAGGFGDLDMSILREPVDGIRGGKSSIRTPGSEVEERTGNKQGKKCRSKKSHNRSHAFGPETLWDEAHIHFTCDAGKMFYRARSTK